MSLRLKLLLGVGVAGLAFALFAILAWNTIGATKVNGPAYRKIVAGKDLVADVLPPPEYIVEANLVAHQLVTAPPAEVESLGLPPEQRLRTLIQRFVLEYARAKDAHRVLTEDVKFLTDEDRARILGGERAVVGFFSGAIGEHWPQVADARLAAPTAMLLFGMINWMFTWFRPEGSLTYEDLAPMVADLFFGGVPAMRLPQAPRDAA